MTSQHTGIENDRERHQGSPGALGGCGALVEVGFIGDLDHSVERGTAIDRGSVAVGERVREPDPAMTPWLFERDLT